MIAKSLKIGIVLAVVLAFLGGTAMADGRNRDRHHKKEDRGYHKSHNHNTNQHYGKFHRDRHHYRKNHRNKRHYYAHHGYGHRKHRDRHHYAAHSRHNNRHYRYQGLHPLAPRILFLGPLPIPVPPPPNEVLDYMSGRR